MTWNFHPEGALDGQTITGTVVDAHSNHSVSRAAVAVLDLQGSLIAAGFADDAGKFTVTGLAAATYRLEIGAFGYVPAILNHLELADSQQVELHVELPPSPIAIPGVTAVTEGRQRSEERRASTAVARLNHDEIQALGPVPIATVLRHLPAPGVRVTEYQREAGSPIFDLCVEGTRTRTPATMGCRWVAVYVDGALFPDPAEGLRFLSVSDLVSIEYLPPTEAGARWGTGSQAGVLLITTRGRR